MLSLLCPSWILVDTYSLYSGYVCGYGYPWISMDMNIHRYPQKICGYGCEISYPRQPWVSQTEVEHQTSSRNSSARQQPCWQSTVAQACVNEWTLRPAAWLFYRLIVWSLSVGEDGKSSCVCDLCDTLPRWQFTEVSSITARWQHQLDNRDQSKVAVLSRFQLGLLCSSNVLSHQQSQTLELG